MIALDGGLACRDYALDRIVRTRANGILRNALYAGRIVHNRQHFLKGPEREARVSRPNGRTNWTSGEAPHLRIIDDATLAAVQARLEMRGAPHLRHKSRPKHLLSGLVKCGSCSATMIVGGTDRYGR